MRAPSSHKRARESASPPAVRPAPAQPSHHSPTQHPPPPTASTSALPPAAPFSSHPIRTPYSYSYAGGHPPTAFQLPTHLTSFSYSAERELLLSQHRQDDALAHYRPPQIGADLNKGFAECRWRDESQDEGLDALLLSLGEWVARDSTGLASEQLGKIKVITWRGMMTKLMTCLYEAESGASGRGRSEGWEMNAILLDGVLYLEECSPPAKRAQKAKSEAGYKLQSYYGYAFEAYSTVTPPPAPPADASRSERDPFEPPNTAVQWCSVCKSNLGGIRFIVGGEVDCVLPTARKGSIRTDDFCELKTNIVIQSHRDVVNFERNKLLKHYVQSFLLGVPLVVVGFRTRDGFLTGLQSFKTLEIPRLVRGKPHAWDPLACLASARAILDFLLRELSAHPSTAAYHVAVDSSPASGEAATDVPVFRVSFTPTGQAGVSVRELGKDEIEEEVLAAKQPGERVGFLLKSWVLSRLDGRRRRRETQTAQAAERVPSPRTSPAPPSSRSQPPAASFVLQR